MHVTHTALSIRAYGLSVQTSTVSLKFNILYTAKRPAVVISCVNELFRAWEDEILTDIQSSGIPSLWLTAPKSFNWINKLTNIHIHVILTFPPLCATLFLPHRCTRQQCKYVSAYLELRYVWTQATLSALPWSLDMCQWTESWSKCVCRWAGGLGRPQTCL